MGSILGLGSLNTSAGTEKLVALKDRHFWVWNSGTGDWDFPVKGPGRWLTAGAKAEHEEFLDHQFWVNGNDLTRSYNASTWSTSTNVTNAPIAKYIQLYRNRLYLGNIKIQTPGVSGGTISFPSRVWFSDLPEQDSNGNWRISWDFESGNDLVTTADDETVTSASASFTTNGIKPGDPFYIVSGSNAKKYVVAALNSATSLELTTKVTNSGTGQIYWVGGNWFDARSDDGDVITGLNENNDRLQIFKTNTFHRWDENSLIQVRGAPGTTSQRSIANVDAFTFYFHPSGIRRDNGVNAELISEPVWDIVEAMASGTFDDVVAWTDKSRFIKFYIGDTSLNQQTDLPAMTDVVLVYDISMDNWSLQNLSNAITVTAPWIESSVHKIYAGMDDATDDGDVYQLETGTDYDGNPIAARMRTKVYYPTAPEVTVVGERIEEFHKQGELLHVGYRRINQPNPDDIDFRPVQQAFPIDASDMRGIQFEITETSTKTSFLLERLTIFVSGGRTEE